MITTGPSVAAGTVQVGDFIKLGSAEEYKVIATRPQPDGEYVIIQSKPVLTSGGLGARLRTSVLHAADLVAVR